jgi:hypothetical protein
LTRGDKGNDPIEPTTDQSAWAQRNPKTAARLRSIVDRQARPKNYATAEAYHGTRGQDATPAEIAKFREDRAKYMQWHEEGYARRKEFDMRVPEGGGDTI